MVALICAPRKIREGIPARSCQALRATMEETPGKGEPAKRASRQWPMGTTRQWPFLDHRQKDRGPSRWREDDDNLSAANPSVVDGLPTAPPKDGSCEVRIDRQLRLTCRVVSHKADSRAVGLESPYERRGRGGLLSSKSLLQREAASLMGRGIK